MRGAADARGDTAFTERTHLLVTFTGLHGKRFHQPG